MILRYAGNAPYCATQSLRMVMEASPHRGDALVPTPDWIEVLTTMPFGVTYERLNTGPVLYFSSPSMDPDQGIDVALEALGWECDLWRGSPQARDEVAREKLAAALRDGPVLTGPLDMGYLTYDPQAGHKLGSDHFVVVYELDEDTVRLHDPQGFPCARLPVSRFLRAWRADSVRYAKGTFTLRTNFRPVAPRELDAALINVAPRLGRCVQDNPSRHEIVGGAAALEALAVDLRRGASRELKTQMTAFSLPLATRRAIDAARVLQLCGDQAVADLLHHKAHALGDLQFLAVQDRWAELGVALGGLAKIERALAELLPD